MAIIDANAIIRIFLNDNVDMAKSAAEFIKSNRVLLRNEVLAEIIYVLSKVYNISRKEMCGFILKLLSVDNVNTESYEVIKTALNTFENNNLDFVDCLLYAYHFVDGNKIFTFDKKLTKLCEPIK